MKSIKQHEHPEGRRKNIALTNKVLSMAVLTLVLLIFLAGVTSVLVLHVWPDLFGRIFSFG